MAMRYSFSVHLLTSTKEDNKFSSLQMTLVDLLNLYISISLFSEKFLYDFEDQNHSQYFTLDSILNRLCL